MRCLCGGGVRFGALCTNASSFYMMWQCSCLLFQKKKDKKHLTSGPADGRWYIVGDIKDDGCEEIEYRGENLDDYAEIFFLEDGNK